MSNSILPDAPTPVNTSSSLFLGEIITTPTPCPDLDPEDGEILDKIIRILMQSGRALTIEMFDDQRARIESIFSRITDARRAGIPPALFTSTQGEIVSWSLLARN